jgi:hypothetical protein
LAAQAASSATDSTTWTRSPDVLKVVAMMRETSGDSTLGVSGIIFGLIQDSFTTQQPQDRDAPPPVRLVDRILTGP